MSKWLILAAICAPIVAHADPMSAHPGPMRPGPMIAHAAPDTDRPRTQSARPTSYAVTPPASHGYIPDGWAMRATFQGQAMDLQSRDWTADPHAQPRDIEAGYGWRGGAATALIGYESHDFGPHPQQPARAIERDPNQPPPVTSPGVLGFSLVLHGR